MNRHLSRQTPCKSTHNQVDIDDCKKYVLQGYSYKEYLKLFKKVSNGFKPDGMGLKPDGIGFKPDGMGLKPDGMGFKPDGIDLESDQVSDITSESIDSDNHGNLICEYCSKKFLKKEYLEKHLKKSCKMLINFNNIYDFDKNTFGRAIFKGNKNAGEIYIIQNDYVNNNYYKIGITIDVKKRLGQYRVGNTYEPRLHYYFPCPDVKEVDKDLNIALKSYNVKKEIFKGDIEEMKDIIVKLINSKFNVKSKAVEPDIKLGDFSECHSCNKCFYTSKDLHNHFKICEDYKEELNRKMYGKYECLYCNKVYTRKDNLTKHYKTCKEKKEDETVKQSMSDLVKLLNEKDKYFKEELDKRDKELHKRDKEFKMELKEKDNQYKSQIDELIKKAGIQNSTITQNIQNNIKLLNYGNTDISHLTDQDFIGCLKHKNFCIPYLIEKIHFDKDKPENHNIYISNLKNKYVMMFEKKKWETKNRDDTIDKLICDKEGIMEEKLGEWEENGGQYADLRNRYDIYVEKRNIKDVFDQIKDDIELMLYNNKDMISKK